jgi:ATP-dependent Clp protease ATP-binding subunit ClpC
MFVIGWAGLIVLTWRWLTYPGDNFDIWQFLAAKDAGLRFFWLSLIADLFIFLNLERDLARLITIPRRIYEPRTSPVNTGKNEVINIWQTLTEEAQTAVLTGYAQSWQKAGALTVADLFAASLNNAEVKYMLARLGVSANRLKNLLDSARASGQIKSSTDIPGVMLEAYRHAYEDRRLYLELPYIAVAATLDPLVKEVLYDLNIDTQKMENVLRWRQNDLAIANRWQRFAGRARLRPRNRLDRAMTAIATPTLDYFSTDYTDFAQWGNFLPAVSRPEITEQLLRTMDGGHNVILVGDPGVGKMGILEDLAQRMVSDDVPSPLRDKRLVSVSLAKLISGATPAEAEGRLMDLMYEARKSGNVVLVFEEIQGLTGITSGGQGSVDLANVLANFAKRLSLSIVATTTPTDYRRYVEPAALGSVFSKLDLPEPSKNQTIQIVESRLGRLEGRYDLLFSYDAVEQLVVLTDQYIHDRRLPKKALDLLDELCLFQRERATAKNIVGGDDVRIFLADKLHLPLTTVSKDESAQLLDLEKRFHERIVGQNEAVQAVANALRRARASMRDQKRPIANFLFLGPTGVGKTELAKAIAAIYFGDEKNMLRLDMAEYKEINSLSKLIGSSGTKGILTEAVRRTPYALLLLDEIEKAHPDVINVFLQVMDDARLTDGLGETFDFRNVIIIATSNAGSNFIRQSIQAQLSIEEIQKQLLATELSGYFSPELLNRFDATIVFKPLTLEEVQQITRLLLNHLALRLENEQGVALQVTAEAVSDIARAGFDPTFGARPLRRVIQDKIDAELAKLILARQLSRRDTVVLKQNFEFEIIPAVKL